MDDLANRMVGVDKKEIWECLRRDDGPQGKVDYILLRDQRRLGRDRELLQLPDASVLLIGLQWLSLLKRSGMCD